MNVLLQGVDPQLGAFFHTELPQVEANVTNILTSANGRIMLHRILASGEVVSQEMNMPLVRNVIAAIDSFVPVGG